MNQLFDSGAVRAAVSAFPELARLVVLRRAGWRLTPVHGEDGEVRVVQGWRGWPGYWTDVIGIRYVTDAQGLRCDPEGNRVWERTGGLIEVFDGLLELPAPGEPSAPGLVLGAGPRLWTPRS